ncbi:MAG: alpha/beta fold hydrolase [Oscillospiraceae bacterium]|nr:alpha/beta fold hydrolase [Oscillospiraceae bacterium]
MADQGASSRRDRSCLVRKMLVGISILLAAYVVLSLVGSVVIFRTLFGRKELPAANLEYAYTEAVGRRYPRTAETFPSGKNLLRGYRYAGGENGTVVIVSGFAGGADTHLPEAMYFVDHGWTVFCFDGTGARESEGSGVMGLSQLKLDLLAALAYLRESSPDAPVVLYGHSQGAYAAATVLNDCPEVRAAVCIAAFESPVETMYYHAKQRVGMLADLGYPFLCLYNALLFGSECNESASAAIAEADVPVLVVSGSEDETVPDAISLYAHCAELESADAQTLRIEKPPRNHHSTLWRSEDGASYFLEKADALDALRDRYGDVKPGGEADAILRGLDYEKLGEADAAFMESVQEFFLRSVS